MKCDAEIIIIGMGPIGLLSALLIARQGINVIIVDKRHDYFQESRSIGIHPPLLDYFESIGILPTMLAEGNIIKETHVHLNKKQLFKVELDLLETKNKFVLTLPQNQTENILLTEIKRLKNVDILRGKTLHAIKQNLDYATSYFNDGSSFTSKFVLGCDGKNSTVRDSIGIDYDGQPYSDSYCMADFNNTNMPQEIANIILHREGLVESLPLPNNKRRWVIRTGKKHKQTITPTEFKNIIERRKPATSSIGEQISELRYFHASRFIADRFFNNRVILLGDAAHVISPIGGQGMNLGWIATASFSQIIKQCLQSNFDFSETLKIFESEQKKFARLTIRRSEKNMSFGRPSSTLTVRANLLKILSQSFYKNTLIKEFTMGNIELKN